MKYKVDYQDKKEKFAFIGMNNRAAKAHGIAFKHKSPEHTIEVYKGVPKSVRLHTLHHEEMEEYQMRVRHLPYHNAHKIALKFENLEKPFPKTKIKEKLKKWGVYNG